MKSADVIKILAACGVVLSGPVTPDALAFARAVDIGSQKALLLFAQENPRSALSKDALRLSQDWSVGYSSIRIPFSKDGWLRDDSKATLKLAAYNKGDGGNSTTGDRSPAANVAGERNIPKSQAVKQKAAKQKAAIVQQQQAVKQIEIAVKQFSRDTNRCRGKTLDYTRTCVADALDKFSRGLETVPDVPGGVAPVAIPVVKQAAERIRKARTKRAARAAIAAAVPEIKQSMELVMVGAEDSVYRLQVRQRSLVIKSLTVADQVLVRAAGI